ncbi:MAG: chloride channel protein, partial [Chloroflexota bacterium]
MTRGWQIPELSRGIVLAAVIGAAAGVGAVVFKWMIAWVRRGSFDVGGAALGWMGEYQPILILGVGGLVVGLLVRFLAGRSKGYGVPEVMIAVNARGGRLSGLATAIHTLASAVCIGSGGSVGLHGPVVHLGSGIGSALGQWSKLREDWVKLFVACGAAGGISATFNAPIAGIFFAQELVLRRFSVRNFTLVGISSVSAGYVARYFFGDMPIFTHVPQYTWSSGWEILFYVLLGIVAAFVGLGFIELDYRCEGLFSRWRFPSYLKPAVGGLLVGLIGVFYPQIFGVGYEATESAILAAFGVGTLVVLCLLKVV